MPISAAPAYDSTHVANDFAAMTSVRPVAMSPLKSFESNVSGQTQRLNLQVVGVESQIDRAISQVFDTHRKMTKSYGFAGLERGKSANIINPAKDGMLLATAAIMPAFAPVASALAIASVLNYANADRKSHSKQKSLKLELEDTLRSSTSSRQSIFDIPWEQTGYNVVKPANDQDVSLDEFEFISKPPEQNTDMQVLLGQRAQVRHVQAVNSNRAIKGVSVSADSIDAAKDMDLKRLNDPKILEFNLPGNFL